MELEYEVKVDRATRAQFAFFNDAIEFAAEEQRRCGRGAVIQIVNDEGLASAGVGLDFPPWRWTWWPGGLKSEPSPV